MQHEVRTRDGLLSWSIRPLPALLTLSHPNGQRPAHHKNPIPTRTSLHQNRIDNNQPFRNHASTRSLSPSVLERHIHAVSGSHVSFVPDCHAQWHFSTKRSLEER